MRTIIHDLDSKKLKKIKFRDDDYIINSLECNNNCIGCFSCWIKHPKVCAIKDKYSNIVDYIKKSDELIIISKNRYGCYSNQTKRILERCIGYVLPYFTIRDGKIHHMSRYRNMIKFKTYFYGNISENEKESISKLIKANAINLNTNNYEINFLMNIGDKKCIL